MIETELQPVWRRIASRPVNLVYITAVIIKFPDSNTLTRREEKNGHPGSDEGRICMKKKRRSRKGSFRFIS